MNERNGAGATHEVKLASDLDQTSFSGAEAWSSDELAMVSKEGGQLKLQVNG